MMELKKSCLRCKKDIKGGELHKNCNVCGSRKIYRAPL
jgi:hypothetical protein